MAKKAGRNKEKCKLYAAAGQKEKNKVEKLLRTLKKQPNNRLVMEALKSRGEGELAQEVRKAA